MRTGALDLVETARRAGIEICFANPGTSELPLVTALDQVPGMRAVLGLFEGVCSGAADGWGRMTGRPAATLLHLGPGLANALANLHNARRARTPVVNWIGQHATDHIALDAPLTSDIAALAGSVGWTRSVESPVGMAEASLAAIEAALGPPGRVASLILPADCQWEPGSGSLSAKPAPARPKPSAAALPEALRLLRRGRAALLLGSSALTARGLQAAAQVAAATGCRVWTATFAPRQECGRCLPPFPPLPYYPEKAREGLDGVTGLVLAGERDPISFFAYPGQPSRLAPDGAPVHLLADPDAGVDAALALEALARELGAPPSPPPPRPAPAFVPGVRPLDPDALGRTLAALLPEGAIVVNEAVTSRLPWTTAHAPNAAPHTMLGFCGGAIGQGLPVALGAALACPDRRVIALQADGSGLYTLQALWSMAHEGADVTVVVCANRCYRILQVELARAGSAAPGPKAQALTELKAPAIDWTALAKGFGVPACRATTAEELAAALRRALAEPGPALIEALLLSP